MMKSLRRISKSLLPLAVSAMMLLGLAPISPALASPPQITVIEIDDAEIDMSCGFPIEGHLEGTLRILTHYDQNGNPTRELAVYNLRSTLTNVQTGESISTPNVGIDMVTFQEDGSVTFAVVGLVARFVVPGQGLVGGRVGRMVIRFTEGNPPEVVFQAGMHYPLRPIICATLGE